MLAEEDVDGVFHARERPDCRVEQQATADVYSHYIYDYKEDHIFLHQENYVDIYHKSFIIYLEDYIYLYPKIYVIDYQVVIYVD